MLKNKMDESYSDRLAVVAKTQSRHAARWAEEEKLGIRERVSNVLLSEKDAGLSSVLRHLVDEVVIKPIDEDGYEPISKAVRSNISDPANDFARNDDITYRFAWRDESVVSQAPEYAERMKKMFEEMQIPYTEKHHGVSITFKGSDLLAAVLPIIEIKDKVDRREAIQKFWEAREPSAAVPAR